MRGVREGEAQRPLENHSSEVEIEEPEERQRERDEDEEGQEGVEDVPGGEEEFCSERTGGRRRGVRGVMRGSRDY